MRVMSYKDVKGKMPTQVVFMAGKNFFYCTVGSIIFSDITTGTLQTDRSKQFSVTRLVQKVGTTYFGS